MSGLQNGLRVPPQSVASIRKIALNTRRAFGLPESKIDLKRFLEKLHLYGIIVDVFEEKNAPVGLGIEACWVPEGNTLYIHERVYEAACRGAPRETFTIAHEIGHIVLAHRRTLNRSAPGTFPVYENSEWQANVFAGEFSMPLPTILERNLWSPQTLAQFFNVSLQAATIRLTKLREEREKK